MDRLVQELQHLINDKYNPENDVTHPMVSYTESILIEAVLALAKEVDGLKAQVNDATTHPDRQQN